MLLSRRAGLIGAVATLSALATQARAGGSSDLSTQITDTLVRPLSTGASAVFLKFNLNGWPTGWTYTARHFCPVGVEMSSPGFAVLPQPDTPSDGVRNTIRLTNLRNMVGSNGEQGISWYIRNDGDSAGACILELSFVARRIV